MPMRLPESYAPITLQCVEASRRGRPAAAPRIAGSAATSGFKLGDVIDIGGGRYLRDERNAASPP